MSAEPRILFLRGVNVGANRKLPMAGLRALLAGLGLQDIATHIQSGNAVFRDPEARPGLAEAISAAIGAAFAFAPEAMVMDRAALEAVLAANPFAEAGRADGAKVLIGFPAAPLAADPAPLDALAAPGEGWALTPGALYLHLPHGVGRSRLAAQAERALKLPLTMRNQRVVGAVADLARGI